MHFVVVPKFLRRDLLRDRATSINREKIGGQRKVIILKAGYTRTFREYEDLLENKVDPS